MTDPTRPEDKDKAVPSELQEEIEAFVKGTAGLLGSLKEIFMHSREEIVRSARVGKVRLDLYQMKKDRERLVLKLGESAFALLSSGALMHPDLAEPFGEVAGLDERIAAFEAEIAELAAKVAEAPGTEEAGAAAGAAAEPEVAAAAEAEAAEEEQAIQAEPAAPPAAEPEAEKPKARKASTRKPARGGKVIPEA